MASYTSTASRPSYGEDGILYMAAPPPGHVRHPENPPSLHGAIHASSIATTMVALLAVGLRIFTRTHTSRGTLYPDDYLLIIAMIFSLSLLGVAFEFCKSGLGTHLWDIKFDEFSPSMPGLETASTMLYSLSIAFSRLSILVLYLQLTREKYFRYFVWTLIGTTCAYVIAYELITLFGCTPVAASWDISKATDPNTKCIDKLANYAFLSVSNIVMDIAVLLLPIPIVWPLQMPMRQKISVFFVFSTGALVVGIAIKRLTLLAPLMTSPDYSWDATRQFHWALGEVSAGIVCASIPALRPLVGRYIPSLLPSQAGLTIPKDSSSDESGSERTRYKVLLPIWRQSSLGRDSQNSGYSGHNSLRTDTILNTIFGWMKRTKGGDGGGSAGEEFTQVTGGPNGSLSTSPSSSSSSSPSEKKQLVSSRGGEDGKQRSLPVSPSSPRFWPLLPATPTKAKSVTISETDWTEQQQGTGKRIRGSKSIVSGGIELEPEYHSWLLPPPPPKSHQGKQQQQGQDRYQHRREVVIMADPTVTTKNWWSGTRGGGSKKQEKRKQKEKEKRLRHQTNYDTTTNNSLGTCSTSSSSLHSGSSTIATFSSSAAAAAGERAQPGQIIPSPASVIHVVRQTTIDYGRAEGE